MIRRVAIGRWDKLWKHFETYIFFKPNRELIEMVLHLLGSNIRGARIVEVGAGSGSDIIAFKQFGAETVALDFAPAALRVCKKLADSFGVEVTLLQGDGFYTPFKSESFDLVYSVGVVEHFHNVNEFIKEQIRVLRPGGYILIDVPQKFNPYTVVKHIRLIFGKHPFGWETQYSVEELRRLGQHLGIRFVRAYGRGSVLSPKLPTKLVGLWNRISDRLNRTSIGPYISLNVGVAFKKE